ncbi:hypothetical protein SFC07_07065 [Corynebacterium callunae]|uniref:hypothetical protein n=1 Tax=Corynebacterium callunae TaxID=1721 RepID=UPI0039828833
MAKQYVSTVASWFLRLIIRNSCANNEEKKVGESAVNVSGKQMILQSGLRIPGARIISAGKAGENSVRARRGGRVESNRNRH